MDIFHRHREAQEPELADAMLELALQTPEYRPEALIWKGINALPTNAKLAFIYLSNAARALPGRADVHALLGRSMLAQGQPKLATRYLSAVWQKLPNDPSLRMTLWHARTQSISPTELRRIIFAHLPDITAPTELNFVLKILAAQTDAPSTVGVVRYLPEEKEIQGWAVDLRNVHAPVALVLEANAKTLSVMADMANPLLTAAGLPATHGGIRIKVPSSTLAVTVRFATGMPLLGSPLSAMPAFVPPVPLADVGKHHPVDVLIPIYDGLEETLECINSAIAARKLNRTRHRLVVLDDATPLPSLRKALKVLASKGKITLLHQPVNLGFIRTMNRAMALSPCQDVVWLNADTRVHGNWLDRLRDCAYADADIASVTPFTNNGELMSFPVSRVSAPMPSPAQHELLDTLASQLTSPMVQLETGCGFCLYIKRSALDEVGYLDETHLIRGYGEETDWCIRASERGLKHMGAVNVFVAHRGGCSFGEEKSLRVAYNNAVLRERYPNASERYDRFCERDPLKKARFALHKAKLLAFASKNLPLENRTLRIVSKLHASVLPVLNKAILEIMDTSNGRDTQFTLVAKNSNETVVTDYKYPTDAHYLKDVLKCISLAQILDKTTHKSRYMFDFIFSLLGSTDTIVFDSLDDQSKQSDADPILEKSTTPCENKDASCPKHRGYVRSLVYFRRFEFSLRRENMLPRGAILITDNLSSQELITMWRRTAWSLRKKTMKNTFLVSSENFGGFNLGLSCSIFIAGPIYGITHEEYMTLAGSVGAISLTTEEDVPSLKVIASCDLPKISPYFAGNLFQKPEKTDDLNSVLRAKS
jgi:GT2 family glycosyltransferase